MSFNISGRSVVLLACGLALCACTGERAARRPGAGTVALSAPAEPPPGRDAEPDDAPPIRPERMPRPGEIFDFHPPGSRPGSWRQPFLVSYTEGPLNRYRLKTLAELRALRDHRYDLAPPSAVAAR